MYGTSISVMDDLNCTNLLCLGSWPMDLTAVVITRKKPLSYDIDQEHRHFYFIGKLLYGILVAVKMFSLKLLINTYKYSLGTSMV